MAHFMTVAENVIRVQLPGGAIYAPALREAASKTASRTDLPDKRAAALDQLVDAAIAALNSGNSSSITLEMDVHRDSIGVKLLGKNRRKPAKKALARLGSVASSVDVDVETRANKASFRISFDVGAID